MLFLNSPGFEWRKNQETGNYKISLASIGDINLKNEYYITDIIADQVKEFHGNEIFKIVREVIDNFEEYIAFVLTKNIIVYSVHVSNLDATEYSIRRYSIPIIKNNKYSYEIGNFIYNTLGHVININEDGDFNSKTLMINNLLLWKIF